MRSSHPKAVLLLVGGPAGAGKSTVAHAWCAMRQHAVHIELDEIRSLIISGRVDPQQPGILQSEQYVLTVRACCALARVFLDAGYDVAIDDVLPPDAFERDWRPLLDRIDWRLVIILPSLEQVLLRSQRRAKRVLQEHSHAQYAACSEWPQQYHVDTTGLTVEESLTLIRNVTGT